VHVISHPLTDYLRFELVGYQANVEAGEDVRIADRGEHPELVTLSRDFWIFDADTPDAWVVQMHYDAASHPLGHHVTSDLQVIDQCRQERDLALAWSTPLHEYTATLDV